MTLTLFEKGQQSWTLRPVFVVVVYLFIDQFFHSFTENVDKENEDMRRAIRQKTEERDNYKRARFSVRSRGNE
jgi:hypothetical protein